MVAGIRKLLALFGGVVGLFLIALAAVTWPRKNGGLTRSCPSAANACPARAIIAVTVEASLVESTRLARCN